ncbi:hypothetical protein HMPREF9061_01510 [Actinomyces sp. oral taxon 181 str. F0379]|nr:hypothetical protein HMPREF9061_01510 [Actinomyces sp. oral taxon 181 str. F0379]
MSSIAALFPPLKFLPLMQLNVSEMDTREQRFLLLLRHMRSTSITFTLTRQTHTGWAAIVSFFRRATLH